LATNSISIGELATLLTAAGVGIYVLGLIGVALSIRLTFTNSWSTAWYAASLMPRVVVAGQGMRVWRRGMFSALFTAVFGLYFSLLVRWWLPEGGLPEKVVGSGFNVVPIF